MTHYEKWDKRFLGLTDHVAQWSKDPSTKVGAVIVRQDRTIASIGYNGFPRGVIDSDERYNDKQTKYNFVCHAEANAILNAKEPLHNCTIYVSPLFPCKDCAKLIIQSGIWSVVAREPKLERWQSSYDVSLDMFKETNTLITTYKKEEDVKEICINENIQPNWAGCLPPMAC